MAKEPIMCSWWYWWLCKHVQPQKTMYIRKIHAFLHCRECKQSTGWFAIQINNITTKTQRVARIYIRALCVKLEFNLIYEMNFSLIEFHECKHWRSAIVNAEIKKIRLQFIIPLNRKNNLYFIREFFHLQKLFEWRTYLCRWENWVIWSIYEY